MYLVLEGLRNDPQYLAQAKKQLCKFSIQPVLRRLTVAVELNPSLLDYFVTITAKLRWDEANELPQTRVGNTLRICQTLTLLIDLSPLLEGYPSYLRHNRRCR